MLFNERPEQEFNSICYFEYCEYNVTIFTLPFLRKNVYREGSIVFAETWCYTGILEVVTGGQSTLMY